MGKTSSVSSATLATGVGERYGSVVRTSFMAGLESGFTCLLLERPTLWRAAGIRPRPRTFVEVPRTRERIARDQLSVDSKFDTSNPGHVVEFGGYYSSAIPHSLLALDYGTQTGCFSCGLLSRAFSYHCYLCIATCKVHLLHMSVDPGLSNSID